VAAFFLLDLSPGYIWEAVQYNGRLTNRSLFLHAQDSAPPDSPISWKLLFPSAIESNMTTETPSSALEPAQQDSAAHSACAAKASRFSPTLKGALIGAAAGSILPVFGTFSGAVIGGIAGKIYQKKCAKKR